MADWVHCNGCYTCPPSSEVKFLLTSCGHLFCSRCYTQPNTPCKVCKSKCMITQLKPNMSADIQLFFMDPLEVATKLHKQLLKVLDFQKSQRKRLTTYRMQRIKQLTAKKEADDGVEDLKQELRSLQEENVHLKTLLSSAKGNSIQRRSPCTPFQRYQNNMAATYSGNSTGQSKTSFSQILGSRITPPPAMFARASPSPRNLADCKRSVEYNSKLLYKGYHGGVSR